MADWSLPRKPRKSNFSTDEVDVLVDAVKRHYDVLYGKFAKRAANRWVRQKAWMDILRKVNGVSVEKRTLQEVKNKWKKCQYVLKEKAGLEDAEDSSWEDIDSMPLQERLSKMASQEKMAAQSQQVLKSQPLSPTKLKVTRQAPKMAAKPVEPPQSQSPVNEEMCLRWNSHHSNMQTAFPNILNKEQYVDVTLAAEGKTLKCHRLILSSCSPYFEEILSGISPFQHPVLFMRDIPFWILKSLCDFMYAGEVHIFQNKLEELLTVAEALKIKGLAGKSTPPENQEEQPNKTANNNNNDKEVKKKQQQHHEKEKVHHNPPPMKKNPVFMHPNNFESTSQDYDDDLLDPLDLLEPLYEEVAEEKKPPSTVVKPKENKYQYQPIKKPFTRRLRKRKFSEQREPSPPPVFSFRKGTRSRPNVKIPKYYHTDFTNPSKQTPNAQTDPLLDVDEIKTEPIDVEDNLIDYSDDDHYLENSLEPANCDSPIIITSAKPPLPATPEKFKKIKLSKPIITEVHTIEETKTTSGGLEVIKITVQQPEEVVKKRTRRKAKTNEVPPILDEPEPMVTEAIAEVRSEAPKIAEVHSETPKIAEVHSEAPKIAEVHSEAPEIAEVHSEAPEIVEVHSEAPEIAEVHSEAPEIVEVHSEAPEIVEVHSEAPEIAEVHSEVPEIVEVHSEVPEIAEVLSEAPDDDCESQGDDLPLVLVQIESASDNEAPILENEASVVELEPQLLESEAPVLESEALPESVIETDNAVPNEVEITIEESAIEVRKDDDSVEEAVASDIQIEDVRSTCLEEMEEEQRRTTSLDHLEKEAMNVANAINMENQAGPPDIE